MASETIVSMIISHHSDQTPPAYSYLLEYSPRPRQWSLSSLLSSPGAISVEGSCVLFWSCWPLATIVQLKPSVWASDLKGLASLGTLGESPDRLSPDFAGAWENIVAVQRLRYRSVVEPEHERMCPPYSPCTADKQS